MNITQVPAHPSNYTSQNTKKQGIVFHWIVGEISSADAVFSRAGSKASAHYSVGSNGQIHQHVSNSHIAWHAGNWEANKKYIGIEHAGGQLVDDTNRKKPTQVCHDTSVQLCVKLCKELGIKQLVLGQNAFRHNQFTATPCCGSLDVDYIINKTNQILAGNYPTFGFTLQVKNNNIYFRDWNSNQVMFNVPYKYNVYKTVAHNPEFFLVSSTVTFPQNAGNPLVVDLDKDVMYRVEIAGYSQSVDLRPKVIPEVVPALEPTPIEEDLQPGLIESPVATELQDELPIVPVITNEPATVDEQSVDSANNEYKIDSVQEIKFVPNPDVVPREDYEQLVNKILDNVEAQKGDKWSWNKFWVGLSKNGFYVQLIGVVLSVALAYAEQNTGSNGVLIGTTTIAILQALRQALKAKD